MYESFFALKEKPFALTPNPRFLFLSKTHNEVYAHLIYGKNHHPSDSAFISGQK
jgi:general secretion pathway protein A